ncbi:LPXTG cell wall anchor domain-containing protein [Listeria ivanovii]
MEQWKLPETGDTNYTLWWASLGLILVGFASITLIRNSRKHHETHNKATY